MAGTARELPIPKAAALAEQGAEEILSVWIVNRQELASVFPPDLYGEDVWKWGRLLANVGRYVADAYAKQTGAPQTEVLEAIRINFDEALREAGKR
jgi:Domain of unknown function (DUF5076)